MASSITSITKPAAYHWQYTWSGTAPFYVYSAGELVLDATTLTTWIFQGDSNTEPPVVEVRDSTEAESTISQIVNPQYAIFQWYQASNAAQYVVQESSTDGGATVWTTRRTLFEDGSEYYTFQTPVLDDVTTATWRVAAVDTQSNYTVIQYQVFMVRNPDPPEITLSYDNGTGLLTVSAA